VKKKEEKPSVCPPAVSSFQSIAALSYFADFGVQAVQIENFWRNLAEFLA